jgi:hypothetical protein
VRVSKRQTKNNNVFFYKTIYELVIQFKNQKRIRTHHTETEEEPIDNLALRLANEIGCPSSFAPQGSLLLAPLRIGAWQVNPLVIALLASLGLYLIMFRFVVGPLQNGMWRGNLAPLFLTCCFISILQGLRQIPRD